MVAAGYLRRYPFDSQDFVAVAACLEQCFGEDFVCLLSDLLSILALTAYVYQRKDVFCVGSLSVELVQRRHFHVQVVPFRHLGLQLVLRENFNAAICV